MEIRKLGGTAEGAAYDKTPSCENASVTPAIYDAQFNAHAYHVDLLHRAVRAPRPETPESLESPEAPEIGGKVGVRTCAAYPLQKSTKKTQITSWITEKLLRESQTTSEQSGFKVERIP